MVKAKIEKWKKVKAKMEERIEEKKNDLNAVSYTHLTLPTILLV